MTLHQDEQARECRIKVFAAFAMKDEQEADKLIAALLVRVRLAELTELEGDYHSKGYRTPALLTARIACQRRAAGEEGR